MICKNYITSNFRMCTLPSVLLKMLNENRRTVYLECAQSEIPSTFWSETIWKNWLCMLITNDLQIVSASMWTAVINIEKIYGNTSDVCWIVSINDYVRPTNLAVWKFCRGNGSLNKFQNVCSVWNLRLWTLKIILM